MTHDFSSVTTIIILTKYFDAEFQRFLREYFLFRDHIESTLLFACQKSNGSFSKALPLQNVIRIKRMMAPSKAIGNIACHVTKNNKTSNAQQ